MMHENDGWFLLSFIETEGSQTSTLVSWGKFLNSNLFTETVFFSLVLPLYWLGNKVKNWNKIIFVSKFLQKDKWACKDGTEVETLGRSLEMLSNTASVCRWWVYTSSDLVFDKGTHEALSWCCHCLSAGRGNPSFVSEGSSTNSKNLKPSTKLKQTERVDGDERLRFTCLSQPSRPRLPRIWRALISQGEQ